MRMSKMFLPTLREVSGESEASSYQLMQKAGLIRRLASGIYNYMPLGLIAFRKIESIVREEMNKKGAQEIAVSSLIPSELYMESGRWSIFGPEMFRLKDRNDRDFCLGPTHEETFTDIIRNSVKSYRELPVILYQIQTKYRDERRPRGGLLRARTFTMKDAYSFDADERGLDISYEKMHEAYCSIFKRLGLEFIAVEADSGAMGGSGSHEFMVMSQAGDDYVALCGSCGYSANVEKAKCSIEACTEEEIKEIKKIATPDVRTIDELVSFLNTDSRRFAKTLIYKAGRKVAAVMVRGDREVNETKLKNLLNDAELVLADAETVEKATGAAVGFAGPVGINADLLVVDEEVAGMRNIITGANDTGYHYINVNYGRDFTADILADVRNVKEGDKCPVCGEPIRIAGAIEVGHIFKLGTKYSEALKAVYLDDCGIERPIIMGSYGIGIDRTMAAIIEQHHDDDGIIWPFEAAPYQVIIVPVMSSNDIQMKMAEDIYNELSTAGVEVLLDDRDERAGVKFKDADLIGIPVRITVGKRAGEGFVEYKLRCCKEWDDIRREDILKRVLGQLHDAGINI